MHPSNMYRQLLRAGTVLGMESTAMRQAGAALHPRGGDRQDTRRHSGAGSKGNEQGVMTVTGDCCRGVP